MEYNLSATWTVALIVWAVWELAWKGYALWHAGRNGHRNWFIALLLINSVGILPMIYILINYVDQGRTEEDRYHHEKAIPFKG